MVAEWRILGRSGGCGSRGRRQTLTAALVCVTGGLWAQAPQKAIPVRKFADRLLLVEGTASPFQQAAQGFEQAYPESGSWTRLQLDPDLRRRQDQLAVVQGSPRVVVAIGTQAARAAQRRWPSTPLVYCLALNPRQDGLSGPDTGGVTLDVEPSRQLAILQKLIPTVRRIGVVYDQTVSGDLIRQAQQSLPGPVRLVRRDVRTPVEAAQAIRELIGQVDAFWLLLDPVVANPANFRLLADLSQKNQVPLLAPAAPFVEAGALLSVGPDYLQAGRRAAEMARQVITGQARAGGFAEAASELVVTINGAVARQLGVAIPRDLRATILSPQDAP